MNVSAVGNMAARPKMLICYLCGREYGKKSLPIHVPQCQKKWLDEEAKKPKKERRPLPRPPPPDMVIAASSGSGFNVDAFNDAAYSQWEGTLEQCPICDRTFRPEAFQHHNKSCTVEHPAKKAGTGLTAASLSNKIQPGLISGTQHSAKGKAELKPGDQVLGNKVQPGTSRTSESKPWNQDIMGNVIEKTISPEKASNEQGENSKSGGFCDECGFKFVRIDAKFCSECGTKRPA